VDLNHISKTAQLSLVSPMSKKFNSTFKEYIIGYQCKFLVSLTIIHEEPCGAREPRLDNI